MEFKRKKYLNSLIASKGNGMVKIVTGGRRCGKSYLLFVLFHQHLKEQGVEDDHIIEVSLDDRQSRRLRDPDILLDYISEKIQQDGRTHYVILDEIQLVDDFVEVLLSLMHNPKLDVFVSGSNSKFLSTDVVTEFRGRGDEIRVWPLSFSEYYETIGGDRLMAWRNYYTFGGLPQVSLFSVKEKKNEYLRNLYELTYLRDVVDCNKIRNKDGLRQLIQILASSIGSSTNPKRISNTFKSVENIGISHNTIKDYIKYLQDAFLIEEALRYDVKGRKYIGAETKFYFTDMGLRGAILNFRQQEENHIMENVIYNELRMRGYQVDVGMVNTWKKDEKGQDYRSKLEIDFVANKGYQRYYIQSAFSMADEDKRAQEEASLNFLKDAFKRIIIVRDDTVPYYNDKGYLIIGLLDFLLQPDSLEK